MTKGEIVARNEAEIREELTALGLSPLSFENLVSLDFSNDPTAPKLGDIIRGNRKIVEIKLIKVMEYNRWLASYDGNNYLFKPHQNTKLLGWIVKTETLTLDNPADKPII